MRLFDKNKAAAVIFASGLALTVLLCVYLYCVNSQIERVTVDENRIKTELFTYAIDCAKAENGSVVVYGWALKTGEDTGFFNNSVLLMDTGSGEYIKIRTDYRPSYNITLVMNDGHDYENSGFYARVKTSRLRKGAQYRVCVEYGSDGSYDICETEYVVRVD